MNSISNLVSAADLMRLLADQQVCLLDCSWYLPTQDRAPKDEYLQHHIPGAQFFDIDEVCDQYSDLPHMLPNVDEFSNAVSALGVSNLDEVICYDSHGVFSAARVWWMFKVFGHSKVRVLNGGLQHWIAEGGVTKQGTEVVTSNNYTAHLNQTAVADLDQIRENIKSSEAIVIDARPHGRFTGELPEPRPELPSGHISGSHSLPYTELIGNGQLKDKRHLLDTFEKLGITGSQNVITSCGSGVTAAILTLALTECGFGLQRLYDGAWTEWASKLASEVDS